jgi:hypothetical protein
MLIDFNFEYEVYISNLPSPERRTPPGKRLRIDNVFFVVTKNICCSYFVWKQKTAFDGVRA